MNLVASLGKILWWPIRWRWLAKALIGIEFGRNGPDDYYFDLGTLALLHRAGKVLQRGEKVLDLGTGAHAVIGLALWRRLDAQVVGAELNPTLVRLATEAVARNGATIQVRESRFFSAISEDEFDVVIFNPPYVPLPMSDALSLPAGRRSQWDGGEDGLAVIDQLLTAVTELNRPVQVLCSSNRWFVTADRVQKQVSGFPRIKYEEMWRHPVLPIDIHSLRGPIAE